MSLGAESAAVAAERYTQARSGVLSTPELGQFIDGLFDEVTKLLLENAELRLRLQRVESALCVAVSERDDVKQARDWLDQMVTTLASERDSARAAASLGRSA